MKAWILDALEGVERMRIAEVADPTPAAGEVVLKVHFAALNPADAYLAKGQYPGKPPFPHILGRDGIGQVVAVGANVAHIQLGDLKAILRGPTGVTRWGTFAELVSVPTESLVDPPAGWSEEQASCATLVYLTAYQALTQWDDLRKDAAVLISGASGGVGVAGTQLGVAMGYTLFGLSRDSKKREELLKLGMTAAFDPSSPAWKDELKKKLGDRKVNLAIDNIGGSLFNDLLATLGNQGRVSVVGRLAGEVPQFNTASLFFRRLRIGGVAVGSYTNQESRQAWRNVVDLLAKRNTRPLIDHVFPFDKLPEAFKRLEHGPMGKVLLSVG